MSTQVLYIYIIVCQWNISFKEMVRCGLGKLYQKSKIVFVTFLIWVNVPIAKKCNSFKEMFQQNSVYVLTEICHQRSKWLVPLLTQLHHQKAICLLCLLCLFLCDCIFLCWQSWKWLSKIICNILAFKAEESFYYK